MAASAQYHQIQGFVPSTTSQYSPLPDIHGQSRVTYFITRTDGTPVPLIPVDELPHIIKLQHVPRVLTPDQTYGLVYIGTSPYTGTTFKLEKTPLYNTAQRFDCQPSEKSSHDRSASKVIPRQFQAPDSLVRPPFGNSNNDFVRMPPSSRLTSAYETSKSWRRSDPVALSPVDSSDAAQNAINAILRSRAGAETAARIGYRSQNTTPPPSGKVPDQEKKEWCTYWILHGDCAYVQQGCRYRHEMPDKAKLSEIGIHRVPRWWLEQNSAIKLGGDRTNMCPVVKPEVWLKPRKGSDADSESSSIDSASSQSEYHSSPPKIVTQPAESPIPSAKIIQTRPSTPTELLINFAPLVPTPSTTAASTSNLSSNTASSTPPSGQEKILKRPSPVVPIPATVQYHRGVKTTHVGGFSHSPPKPVAKTAKVFVPAGESPGVHIADAKRRAAAHNKASRTPSPTVKSSKTGENLEKLIGEMRKAKVGSLSSSIHAPAQQSSESIKHKTRTGCRERRPVSSNRPSAAQLAKK